MQTLQLFGISLLCLFNRPLCEPVTQHNRRVYVLHLLLTLRIRNSLLRQTRTVAAKPAVKRFAIDKLVT
jgi:hypothetical protein